MNFPMATLVILSVSIIMDYTVVAKPKQYLIETEDPDDQVTNDYDNKEVPEEGDGEPWVKTSVTVETSGDGEPWVETSEMSKVILNEGSAESSSYSDNVDSALEKAMTGLKAKYMSEDGSKVDYKGMAGSEEFKIYKSTARMLQLTDPASFSLDKKKAFFINIYNSLTIHAMVYQASMGKLPDSPKNVDKFWAIHCYNIGGQVFTLDEIEHGVLRDNQGHPAAKKNQFESDDPRFQFVCSPLDPRIHFALNCAARSCPPIRVYTELKINRQLDMATVSFLSQDVNISASSRTVTLSKILLWYKGDFITEDTSEEEENVKLLGWLVGKLGEEKEEAIKTAREEKYKVVFKDYNWDSNEI